MDRASAKLLLLLSLGRYLCRWLFSCYFFYSYFFHSRLFYSLRRHFITTPREDSSA
jgi:hypothetical protein